MLRTHDLIPAQILEPSFEEPDGLDLWHSPLRVTKDVRDGIESYQVTFSHTELTGVNLLNLLGKVAPAEEYLSITGVIADWDIVDNPELDSEDKRLVEVHEHLGQPWREFLKSRPAWLGALYDSSPPYFGLDVHMDVPNGMVAKHQLSSPQYDYAPFADVPTPDSRAYKNYALAKRAGNLTKATALLTEYGVEDADEQMFELLKEAINLSRKMKLSNRLRIEALIREGQHVRRNTLVSSLRKLLPEDAVMEIARQTFDQEYACYVTDDGREYFYSRRTFNPETIAQELKEVKTVQKGPFKANVRMIGKTSKSGRYYQLRYVEPGSVERTEDFVKIAPALAWAKDVNGRRSFEYERTSETNGGTVHTDGLLGPLVVAYFSPQVVAEWPKSMPIGKTRHQPLGAAQVPVLALFPKHAKQLLCSDFIRGVEEAVA